MLGPPFALIYKCLGYAAIIVSMAGVSVLVKVAVNWTLTAIPNFGIQGAARATLADIGIAAASLMAE